MLAGKVGKKSKKTSKSRHSKPSRGQVNDDAGKLQSLDRTIQEHQKAQFYGNTEAQLDFKGTKEDKKSSKNSLKGLEYLSKVEPASKQKHKMNSGRDLRALDDVLATLSKMEFSPSEKEQPASTVAEQVEIEL